MNSDLANGNNEKTKYNKNEKLANIKVKQIVIKNMQSTHEYYMKQLETKFNEIEKEAIEIPKGRD